MQCNSKKALIKYLRSEKKEKFTSLPKVIRVESYFLTYYYIRYNINFMRKQMGEGRSYLLFYTIVFFFRSIRKDSMSTLTWTVSAMPRSFRLVDTTVRCLDSISLCAPWKWNCRIRINIFEEQNGRTQVFSLQFGSCWFFHGNLPR